MYIRIIVVVSILMSFPANNAMYIFNYVFTNWVFHHYVYFLASLHIQNIFLFKFIHLNMRIITLQYTDGTRTSLQVTEDQDSRMLHKSYGWLKRARSAKEEETIFHCCMWKTQQISRFVCYDWTVFLPIDFSFILYIFLLLCTSGIFKKKFYIS